MKLSSGPPNFLTIFRKENMVPNINFASSWADNLLVRARAGPTSGVGISVLGFDVLEEVDNGRPEAGVPPDVRGVPRSFCRAQSRE